MITGFRVQNFKAFKDTERINLKPLVLLSGINSAGKSSILQALLLLKQTLESGPGMVLNPGEPLLLGSPVNFLFGFTDGKGNDLPLVYDLIFSYIASRDKPETLAPIHNYDNNELLNSLQVALPEVSLVSNGDELICHLQLTFAWGTFGYLKQRTIRVDNLKISLEIDTTPLLSLDINPRGFSGSYRLTLIKEGTIPELQNLEIEQLEVDSFDHFLPESFSISYPEGTDPLRRDISSRLSQFLRQLFDNIQNDLSEKTYYLSSFRKPPIRFYGYSSTTDSLDPQG
ncbi:MAG: AAA family ATPase, partial [Chloroflexi bacterium]|nr:AAA family ATPase [Chloroflexota bacterium]